MKKIIFAAIAMAAAFCVSCNEVSNSAIDYQDGFYGPEEETNGIYEAYFEDSIRDVNDWKISHFQELRLYRENCQIFEGGILYYDDPDAFDFGTYEEYPGDDSMVDCDFYLEVTEPVIWALQSEDVVEVYRNGGVWCLSE